MKPLKNPNTKGQWVHIGTLTEDEIMDLPRDAFANEEWEDLDESIQHHIYEHDAESDERRYGFQTALETAVRDMIELEYESAMIEAESAIEVELSSGRLMYRVANLASDDYPRLRASFPNIDDNEFWAAFSNILADYNMWSFTVDEYDDAHDCPIYVGVFADIRITWNDYVVGITEDEIEYVIEHSLDDETKRYFRGLEAALARSMMIGGYERHVGSQAGVCGFPHWDGIRIELAEMFAGDDQEPKKWLEMPPEERIVYKFDDGFYVQRLTPDELASEGRMMRMCVGDPGMGYIRALKAGEIEIWSLRTPGGRPKLTFEVSFALRDATVFKQIKGTANRLPGWDLGETGKGKMKEFEVVKVLELLEERRVLPGNVPDLFPAMMAISTDPGKYPDAEKLLSPSLDDFWERARERENPGRTFDMPYVPLRRD